MAGMTEKLTGQHVLDADLADWRLMVRSLHAHFATGDFATGLRLAERISAAAEEMNHHPDIDLRYPHVAVRLTSHDTGGVTERDVELARRISAAAADLGVAAEPSRRLAVGAGARHRRPRRDQAVLAGHPRLRPEPVGRRRDQRPGGRPRPRSGSRPPSRTTSPGSASTSTCGCRTTWPSSGSPTRWPRAGRWSATPRRRRTGCSPTPTATRRASAPGRTAARVPAARCWFPRPTGETRACRVLQCPSSTGSACQMGWNRGDRAAPGEGRRRIAARRGSAQPDATMWDRRPNIWDPWWTVLTPERPGGERRRMRTDLLVRTRRVS